MLQHLTCGRLVTEGIAALVSSLGQEACWGKVEGGESSFHNWIWRNEEVFPCGF